MELSGPNGTSNDPYTPPADPIVEAGPLRAARALARSVRNASERILHPLRRLAARRRVRTLQGTRLTVLFVCQGNICRSPYAAAAFDRTLPAHLHDRYAIRSGGFIGPGRASPATAVAVASTAGIDLSRHVSTLLPHTLPETPTLVIVMDADQARRVQARYGRRRPVIVQLGDLDPDPIDRRHVADPIDRPESVFRSTYDRIRRCTAELSRLLTSTE